MLTQTPTPKKTLSHYQDLLRSAKQNATITVPAHEVTLVQRMARRLFIEKSLTIKPAAAATWLITAPDGRQHQATATTANEALEQAVIALGYSPTAINDEEWEVIPQEKVS